MLNINFCNTAYNKLPVDKSLNQTPRKVIIPLSKNYPQVKGFIYSETLPKKRKNPKIVALSERALKLIGLDSELVRECGAEYFSGTKLFENSKPIAHNYCGYQFGEWAGQLGDGRAHILGDVKIEDKYWELQLKGSGLTPYSRFADGNAVLRSTIREYLCSEYMNSLGIPTTRAGTLVSVEELAVRDLYYSGNPKQEQCAVLLRISPCTLRFGSFEICNGNAPSAEHYNELIPQLMQYLIDHHYPHLKNGEEVFKEVVSRTARLCAQWQAYGFCHGVLNTDNMSMLGMTIDYGPFGFMEYFDSNHICNYSDQGGRYSYGNQPNVCKWNLGKLREALKLECQFEQQFDQIYGKEYYELMGKRLGVQDQQIINGFMQNMEQCQTEYNSSFRLIMELQVDKDFQEFEFSENDKKVIEKLCDQKMNAPRDQYLKKYQPKLTMAQIERFRQQLPEEIVNQQVEANKQYQEMIEQNDDKRFSYIRLMWTDWVSQYKARIAGCDDNKRQEVMKRHNPIYILRNSTAQHVIDAAEKGDYSLLEKVQKVVENPFVKSEECEDLFKVEMSEQCVSCSS